MEIHLKMFQWIVAFGAEWRKELPCCLLFATTEFLTKLCFKKKNQYLYSFAVF
jgi:hypothetical protein